MAQTSERIAPTNRINLLADALGASALVCSDDFFASMDNLTLKADAIWIADKFTERGKWMDGWESGRKRDEGHDWCILRLGVPGQIDLFDIDTAHFLGNHAPVASVEGAFAPECTDDLESLNALDWHELLAEAPLTRGSQNILLPHTVQPVTHVRLNIFPDGGVARLKAFGTPIPSWQPNEDDLLFDVQDDEVDLVALRNGGQALLCSDMFFGDMVQLISPQRAKVMGEGWETRRSRRVGYDWILLQLGAVGQISMAVVDTHHFKGNFPESFELLGTYAPQARLQDLTSEQIEWTPLLERLPLKANHPHQYRTEIQAHGPLTHVVLRIYPDGGVSRLRLYGHRSSTELAEMLNQKKKKNHLTALHNDLTQCCGSATWVEHMMQAGPFKTDDHVHETAHSIWNGLSKQDYLDAFSHHPQIGADPQALRAKFKSTQKWALNEQSGVQEASEECIQSLASQNQAYLERFGYIFIVCATGKSAQEMLDLLNARIGNSPEVELNLAAQEQEKITHLRLAKLIKT
jgi:allantoicase